MRLGQNPLKDKPAPYGIKNIVCCVITHFPAGYDEYHKSRFEVIRTCLNTMRDGIHREHTFIVWDNGSKPMLTEWISGEFKPDIFIKSQNVGLNNAKMMMFNMLPLSSIVCYSDDDMYFSDNWLKPQLEILHHFPNVASVSGYPVHTMMSNGTNINTLAWAKKNAQIKHGQLIPEEWNREFCTSVGYDYQSWKERHIKDYDTLITYNGVSAYATSHHAQCVGYAMNFSQALTANDMALSPERDMDTRLDKIGLRLSTVERYVKHIGNVLDDEMRKELDTVMEV